MTQPGVDFGGRFRRQEDRIDGTLNTGKVLAAVAGMVLLLLGVLLRPQPLVFLVVAVLVALFVRAFIQWRGVLGDASHLARDLDDLVRAVAEGREVEHLLASAPLQDERYRGLALTVGAASPSRPDLALAAGGLLEPLDARLEEAASYRPILVLGGLFGTVLFFAFELGRPSLVAGAIAELLPGLQGALLSTLTGLLGSALLGYYVGRADRERSLLEADLLAFVRGPLWARLETERTVTEGEDDATFWSLAAQELRRLREDTTSMYLSVANQVNGYAAALEQIQQRLSSLPAMKVPKELAHLSGVAQGFEQGMKAMNEGVRVLVAAVDIASTDLPERLVQRVAAIQEEQDLQRKSLVSLDRTLAGLSERLRAIDLESVPPELARLSGEVRREGQKIEEIHGATRSQAGLVQRLEEQTRLLEESRTSLDDTRDQLREATAEVGTSTRLLDDVAGTFQTSGGEIENAARRLAETHGSIEALSGAVDRSLGNLARQVDVVRSAQQEIQQTAAREDTLQRLDAKVSRLQSVVQWVERVHRAPLMRVLTSPWLPERLRRRRDGQEP